MRAMFFLLWLAVPTAVWGQAADSSGPLFESVTGAFFALSVADMASSSLWYSEKLGLEVGKCAGQTNSRASSSSRVAD